MKCYILYERVHEGEKNMPKLIDDLQRKILNAARKRLFTVGYSGLSLRAVAQDCGIAVGTIYNYFENKDALVAHITAEDWVEVLAEMDRCCENAKSIQDGFVIICRSVRRFADIYREVWGQFARSGQPTGLTPSRHLMLREQLEERIEAILCRFGHPDEPLTPLLAETLLAAALQSDISAESIEQLAQRLF